MVFWVTYEGNGCNKPLHDPLSTPKLTTPCESLEQNKLYRRLDTRLQFIHILPNQNFRKNFTVKLKDKPCPIAFLNAGRYIQWFSDVVRKTGPLYLTSVPTVFQMWMWIPCFNVAHTDVDMMRLSVRMTKRTGSMRIILVKGIVTACTPLVHRVGEDALSTYLQGTCLVHPPRHDV